MVVVAAAAAVVVTLVLVLVLSTSTSTSNSTSTSTSTSTGTGTGTGIGSGSSRSSSSSSSGRGRGSGSGSRHIDDELIGRTWAHAGNSGHDLRSLTPSLSTVHGALSNKEGVKSIGLTTSIHAAAFESTSFLAGVSPLGFNDMGPGAN